MKNDFIIIHSEKKHNRRLRQLNKLMKASRGDKRAVVRAQIKRTNEVWYAFFNHYLESLPVRVIPDTHAALDERFALQA